MAQKSRNIIPISQAFTLHALLFVILVAAFDWPSSQQKFVAPLAIKASLVIEDTNEPKQPLEKKIKDEPQLENNNEMLRVQAEEEKRINDALIEKKRLEEIQRKNEADRIKREQERQKKIKEEEERREREVKEAELKRIQDIERQRTENLRVRMEMEAKERQAQIDEESRRLDSVKSGELAVYKAMISQKIKRNWNVPVSANSDLDCQVRVRQGPGGYVEGVTILRCNEDDAVKRSIEAAVRASSPLPQPSSPSLFERSILINLTKK